MVGVLYRGIVRLVFIIASMGAMASAGANTASLNAEASTACYLSGPGSPAYRIGVGDLLHVSVWNDKSLERTVTVRPDGMISFPLLNDLQAAGLTPMKLQEKMDSDLASYVKDPQVSVVVQAVNSFTVSVLGEVRKPGRYEMQGGRATVLDALALAGGLTPYARRSGVHVIRNAEGKARELPFHYGRAISTRPQGANLCVVPGDIIIVP